MGAAERSYSQPNKKIHCSETLKHRDAAVPGIREQYLCCQVRSSHPNVICLFSKECINVWMLHRHVALSINVLPNGVLKFSLSNSKCLNGGKKKKGINKRIWQMVLHQQVWLKRKEYFSEYSAQGCRSRPQQLVFCSLVISAFI